MSTPVPSLLHTARNYSLNSEYAFWAPEWEKIRDCMLGETMIKRRGTQYLPKLEGQTDLEYQSYLSRAVFFNTVSRTAIGLVSNIFRRDYVADNLPEGISFKKIARDGRSLSSFARTVATDQIALSRYGVLLDRSSTQTGDPYLVGYPAESILDWSLREENGRTVLERVDLREFVRVTSESGESEVKEIKRVLLLNDDGIYVQRVYFADSTEYAETIPHKRGVPFTHIPFVIFGATSLSADVEKPQLLDIANLNLSHYQSYAFLEHGRFFTATPVYWTQSNQRDPDDSDNELFVGPGVVWNVGKDEKVGILEFNGSGLRFLENAIATKEQQISSLGGRLVGNARGTAAESSETAGLRERAEQAIIMATVNTLNEGFTQLIQWMLDWMGVEGADAVTITFNSDMQSNLASARELRAIESLYKTGLLPIEVIYAVFRDAEILPVGMSLEEFKLGLPKVAPADASKMSQQGGAPQNQSPKSKDVEDEDGGLSMSDMKKLKELLSSL